MLDRLFRLCAPKPKPEWPIVVSTLREMAGVNPDERVTQLEALRRVRSEIIKIDDPGLRRVLALLALGTVRTGL